MSLGKTTGYSILERKNELFDVLMEELKESSIRSVAREIGLHHATLSRLVSDPDKDMKVSTLAKLEKLEK